MLKKIVLGAAGLLFMASMGLEFGATRAYANKVDCDKVMAEINAGKKGTEVAKDLGISASSVYRCKKKAKAAGGSAAAASSPAAASSASSASPEAAASPAAATKPKRHRKSKPGASASPSAAASPAQ